MAKKFSKKDLDDQFEAFLKESMSDDEGINSAKVSKYLKPKEKPKSNKPWWMNESDEEEEEQPKAKEDLGSTGKSFLKSKPKRADISHLLRQTPSPPPTQTQSKVDVTMSRDSLEDLNSKAREEQKRQKSVMLPRVSLEDTQSYTESGDQDANATIPPGMDTLDEKAEKERFFQDLEDKDEPADYGKLNKDLEASGTMAGTLESTGVASDQGGFLKYQEESKEYSDDDFEDSKEQERPKITPRKKKEEKSGNEQKLNLLSKVSLLDTTMDSTMDTGTMPQDKARRGSTIQEEEREDHQTGRDVGLKTKTGTGLFTDTSQEIAALQSALREAGMSTMLGTGDADSVLKDTGVHDKSDVSHVTEQTEGTRGFGLKPVAGGDTDKPSRTVEDLLREAEEIERRAKARQSPPPVDISYDNGGRDEKSDDRPALSPVHKEVSISDLFKDLDEQDYTTQNQLAPIIEHSSPKPPRPAKRSKPKTKYADIPSSGYGLRTPTKPKGTSSRKTAWSPKDTMKQKIKGTETITVKETGKSKVADTHLLASVESFAQYIKEQFGDKPGRHREKTDAPWLEEEPIMSPQQREERISQIGREKALQQEVKDWQEQWKEERKMNVKMRADAGALERDYERKLEEYKLNYEQELFKLKQDNFVLMAKVSEAGPEERDKKKILEGDSLENVSKEQVQWMEREIREQEKLMLGYQQENERLYKEMKAMQITNKATEEKMFKENQRLTAEIVSLRTQLERREVELKNKGIITSSLAQQQIVAGSPGTAILGAGRIAQLNAELRQAQDKILKLEQQLKTAEQARTELENHIEVIVRDRERYEDKIKYAKEMKSQEIMSVQQEHAKEIERLNRKLKWYAENQEMLDRDSDALKEKNDEIRKLKKKIEDLESESGTRQLEQKARAKERSTEAKRIQDLERQVKEMEAIMRKRHPNSLPSLIWAASQVQDPKSPTKGPSVQFLEKQVKKLEAELDKKDEEAKKGLRVMEQKYNAIKFQYEERIHDLEDQLYKYKAADASELRAHPHTSTVALHKELDAVKDRHKKTVAELEAEIERLKKELTTLKNKEKAAAKAEAKAAVEAESELELRVKALSLELVNKDKEVEVLRKMVNQLEIEKKHVEMDALRQAVRPGEKGKTVVKGKGRGKAGKKTSPRDPAEQQEKPQVLPVFQEPYVNGKEYEPKTFSGSHISDVQRENEELKAQVDQLQLECDHQRINMQKAVAEAEASSRRAREDMAEQMAALRKAHQDELQRILTDHAMKHSTSKLVELQSKVDSQQVMLKHLKEQLAQADIDREQLSAARIRETALESQVKQLQDDLREAKKHHSPEMKHFEALHEKITQMENRHRQREQELQQIIRNTKLNAGVELNREVDKWRRMVEVKNQETERFRIELDSILEVLRELQRQGVSMPMGEIRSFRTS
ncbi:centrosomal protein of 162 kDa [Lingula anatina]|uniref:Centrosomal protein of 162 kDa n=1 Tax=Lingula anatina TaxID=7574 RepID=A0A1S3HUA1_LINAN|nr:centrosomal protein of 162 kDa [Lingula anatina]|eukprot:XP_013389121.1 centrosomal protein of 162 kDa [Lingula anatina]